MFEFKQFKIDDSRCGMKVSTDGVLLGAWARVPQGGYVVDLGAGSGLLSMIAAQRGAGRVTAVEIDEGACLDARSNADASPWADSIEVVRADALAWAPEGSVDMLISNPPFFTEDLRSPQATRAQARHAQTLGPLAVLDCALRWLSTDGRVALICPANQLGDLTFHAEMMGLKLRRQCLVRSVASRAPMRALAEFGRHDGPIERETLDIRHADGTLTDDYRRLTADFYLR